MIEFSHVNERLVPLSPQLTAVLPSGAQVTVNRDSLVARIEYPTPPGSLLNDMEAAALSRQIGGLEEFATKYPAAKGCLEPSLAALRDELNFYRQGNRKSGGAWIPKGQSLPPPSVHSSVPVQDVPVQEGVILSSRVISPSPPLPPQPSQQTPPQTQPSAQPDPQALSQQQLIEKRNAELIAEQRAKDHLVGMRATHGTAPQTPPATLRLNPPFPTPGLYPLGALFQFFLVTTLIGCFLVLVLKFLAILGMIGKGPFARKRRSPSWPIPWPPWLPQLPPEWPFPMPPREHDNTPSPLPTRSPTTLSELDWDQFEIFVGELFRRSGYQVELSSGTGADGGIDLRVTRDSERVLVQCKHWKVYKVSVKEIREFYAVLIDDKADRGVMVTTGTYTRDARQFASGKPIRLLGPEEIEEIVGRVALPGENIYDPAQWMDRFVREARIIDPLCPYCSRPMILRRSGENRFWGCPGYPRCKGKRDARRELLPPISSTWSP